jgi:hypothetical protein
VGLSIVVNQGEYQYSNKRGNPRKGLGKPGIPCTKTCRGFLTGDCFFSSEAMWGDTTTGLFPEGIKMRRIMRLLERNRVDTG